MLLLPLLFLLLLFLPIATTSVSAPEGVWRKEDARRERCLKVELCHTICYAASLSYARKKSIKGTPCLALVFLVRGRSMHEQKISCLVPVCLK